MFFELYDEDTAGWLPAPLSLRWLDRRGKMHVDRATTGPLFSPAPYKVNVADDPSCDPSAVFPAAEEKKKLEEDTEKLVAWVKRMLDEREEGSEAQEAGGGAVPVLDVLVLQHRQAPAIQVLPLQASVEQIVDAPVPLTTVELMESQVVAAPVPQIVGNLWQVYRSYHRSGS